MARILADLETRGNPVRGACSTVATEDLERAGDAGVDWQAVARPVGRNRLRKMKLLDFAYSTWHVVAGSLRVVRAARGGVDREQPRQVAVRAAVGGFERGAGGGAHAAKRVGVGEKIAQRGGEGCGIAG